MKENAVIKLEGKETITLVSRGLGACHTARKLFE